MTMKLVFLARKTALDILRHGGLGLWLSVAWRWGIPLYFVSFEGVSCVTEFYESHVSFMFLSQLMFC